MRFTFTGFSSNPLPYNVALEQHLCQFLRSEQVFQEAHSFIVSLEETVDVTAWAPFPYWSGNIASY